MKIIPHFQKICANFLKKRRKSPKKTSKFNCFRTQRFKVFFSVDEGSGDFDASAV